MTKKAGKVARRDKDSQKKLVGRRVYYGGMILVSCEVCGKSWRRGMYSEHDGRYYCTERCVLSVIGSSDESR